LAAAAAPAAAFTIEERTVGGDAQGFGQGHGRLECGEDLTALVAGDLRTTGADLFSKLLLEMARLPGGSRSRPARCHLATCGWTDLRPRAVV